MILTFEKICNRHFCCANRGLLNWQSDFCVWCKRGDLFAQWLQNQFVRSKNTADITNPKLILLHGQLFDDRIDRAKPMRGEISDAERQ